MRRFYLCPICGLFERPHDVPAHQHWLGDRWAQVAIQELAPMEYFDRLTGCETCPTCGSNCPTSRIATTEVVPEPQDFETYGRFE